VKSEEVGVFIGSRLVMSVQDEFHEVELFNELKKLQKGFGYIKNSLVYIYRGKLKSIKLDLKPGIYSKDNTYVFIEPSSIDSSLYSISNLIELNLDKIFSDVDANEDNFVLPDDIEVINNNSEAYVPTIKDNDDFLKYIVKKIIIDKKINLKNYKGKFTNQYALNNMQSGLKKDTKMTVTNFKIWCEILDVDWEIIISDNGNDKLNPLTDDLIISSKQF